MAHRILMQVVFTGAQVFGRAFAQAYKQAAASSAESVIARESGITLDESCRILNIRPEKLETSEVTRRFEHLFNANSPEKGGSFYVQAKVFRAKERIDKELTKHTSPPPNGEGSGSSTAS
ncbi:Pam16-domain-containing protein [Lipomyces arxii]|uniref:Pam16-domain-containing protein n=1 Tax=Lipomyces arxii TaxID=56418 RepID=UPI0034CF15A1